MDNQIVDRLHFDFIIFKIKHLKMNKELTLEIAKQFLDNPESVDLSAYDNRNVDGQCDG